MKDEAVVEREEVWTEREAEHVPRHRDQVSEPWLARPEWGNQDRIGSVLPKADDDPLNEGKRGDRVRKFWDQSVRNVSPREALSLPALEQKRGHFLLVW